MAKAARCFSVNFTPAYAGLVDLVETNHPHVKHLQGSDSAITDSSHAARLIQDEYVMCAKAAMVVGSSFTCSALIYICFPDFALIADHWSCLRST